MKFLESVAIETVLRNLYNLNKLNDFTLISEDVFLFKNVEFTFNNKFTLINELLN